MHYFFKKQDYYNIKALRTQSFSTVSSIAYIVKEGRDRIQESGARIG